MHYIPVVASVPVSSECIVPTATSTSLTLRPSASAETAAGESIRCYTKNLAALYLVNAPILAFGEFYMLGKLPFNWTIKI